ncbi:MAG: arginine repressor [Actinobacteria bacterium]|nr:arginine repressor [Actinomycetota bacterium]
MAVRQEIRGVTAGQPGKVERQKLIQRIVGQREIGTQRELVAALQSLGCPVTQATVSRDIRELELQKVRTHLGRPRYVMSLREHPRDPARTAAHVLKEFCLLIVAAQNLVVVRCEIGTAQTVARSLDNLNHADIVGTVAGDDTAIIVTRDGSQAEQIKAYLDELRNA